jgi:hypothetical protein
LPVWGKDSYTERLLVLFPCTLYCNPRWFIFTRPLPLRSYRYLCLYQFF